MPYTPRQFPELQSVDDLRRFLEEELRQISIAANETMETYYRPVNREPTKVREGLLAFADGTHWNPGAGAGLYEYRGGAWRKL